MEQKPTLAFKYGFDHTDEIFVGCILEERANKEDLLLTVGTEETEDAIIKWGIDTMLLMSTSGRVDVEAADKWDRDHAH
jgi:hypothetical protein|tara:strand:+ start:597 stop:833 length:237 start_codon:yes stop_codon:yes gene_type:complete